ncbi:MAG: thioredoxin domain-containing protein [Patescibacteria group bacterium]
MVDESNIVQRTALGLILIAGVVILVGASTSSRYAGQAREKSQEDLQLATRVITEQDHVQGSRDAPLEIVEYSDFECPYCRALHLGIIPRLKERYGETMVLAYRHFPLPRYPHSVREAEAAECAASVGGEDAFWKYTEALFMEKPREATLTDENLIVLATSMGIPGEAFEICMASGEAFARVQSDKAGGVVAGIAMTPTLLITYGGAKVKVQGSYQDRILEAIDELLTVSEKPPEQ